MALHFRVAFLGFSDFERSALASYFRLAGKREPRYDQVQMLTDADFLVADADHGPSVQLVLATERLAETVFIGSHAPPGATAWMMRPIDALHVMRELDAMVALQAAALEQLGRAAEAASGAMPLEPLAPLAPEPAVSLEPARLLRPMHEPPEPTPARVVSPAAPSLLERAATVAPLPTAIATTPAPAPTPAAPQPPQPPRALVVDDSQIAQRFLESHLQRRGLIVDRAAHSAQALDMMRRHSHDAVFLDVELGPESELDGLGLCQHIKRSTSAMHTTVILVSAHHSELDRVRGALAGCDGYLGKPLDPAELERLLERHRLTLPERARRKKAAAQGAPG